MNGILNDGDKGEILYAKKLNVQDVGNREQKMKNHLCPRCKDW